MEAPGLAEVNHAERDGRWDRAYDGAKTSVVPDDLAEALARNVKARTFFETLDAANRYAILYRVTTAKRADTRAARIATFVAMCEEHKRLHPAARRPHGPIPRVPEERRGPDDAANARSGPFRGLWRSGNPRPNLLVSTVEVPEHARPRIFLCLPHRRARRAARTSLVCVSTQSRSFPSVSESERPRRVRR